MSGDDIVITGVAGRFPNARNVEVLAENLYNGVDMVDTENVRFQRSTDEKKIRMGNIADDSKFDAQFFGIRFQLVQNMDPQGRMLIEHSFEAVIDAGWSPKALRGAKIGVFVGSGTSEYENTWCFERIGPGGFGITGCSRAMLANRISYCLGVNGPSFLLDTACSSSMCALDVACRAIRDGQCEGAMVGGVNLLLSSGSSKVYSEVGFLAPDGVCRPFDNNASGYSKSEAVTMLFLQKRKDARRVYATVVSTRAEYDGTKDADIFKFSGDQQRIMLENFYREIRIDPATVGYLEAHGSGQPTTDFEECQAADAVFCQNRKKPLLIGSIKSNIGHAEPASGGCAITKALLAFQTGQIPPNLHFSQCRQDVPGLVEGRMKVVTETTPLDGPLIAVNSFGFTGHNAHCLLRMFDKEKVNNGLPQDSWPRLVVWSGRTEEAINTLLDGITKRPLDVEQVALINEVQSDSTSGYVFRGFGLYEQQSADKNAVCLGKDVKHYSGVKRPLVFVFSGMGSQWCEMGAGLMAFPIFRTSIQRCHDVLAQHGLDLINILTSPEKTTYDNILHSFVGIAAIQIGLVDILRVLEIKPDYIVGHSVGELGCAYADGSLTAEQMILAAYSRGMASVETKVIFGSMAAVGLGYRNILPLLPAGVEVACHNSGDSCTISGPADLVSAFVVELKRKKIFAREVPCSNIPYHSKYIREFGPKLLSRLRQVIPAPKERSSKWLSTSVPKQKWDQPESQLCSAEYHTNNLLSPVLFEETAALLPSNAILLEIAPHRLLQGILKQSMPEAVYIGLTQRSTKDITLLFNGIGQLYCHGYDSSINRLYPEVEYPVSRGTPMLSPYVKWDHSVDWYVVDFGPKMVKNAGFKQFNISKEAAWQAMEGHVIDGRTLIPETAYLNYVWEAFATLRSKPKNEMEIMFSDVKFSRPTVLAKDADVQFTVRIQSGTGEFEISEDSNSIVSGFIKEVDMENLSDIPVVEDSEFPTLAAKDFYNEMTIRGYEYAGQYKTVVEARGDGLVGAVRWQHNWTTFLDALLQVQMMSEDTRDVVRPIAIQKLLIKTMEHAAIVQDLDPNNTVLAVEASRYLNMLRCGGVEVCGLVTGPMARRKLPKHVLESYSFVPHLPAPKMSTCDALRLVVQLAMDNLTFEKLRVMEVDCEDKDPVVPTLKTVLNDLPHSGFELFLQTQRHFSFVQVRVGLAARSNCTLVIASNCLTHANNLEIAQQSLCAKGYILSREKTGVSLTAPPGCQLIAAFPTESETYLLLQAQVKPQKMGARVVKASADDFTWLTEVRQALKNGPVVVVAENETLTGAVGLVGCVRKERNGHRLSAVVIEDAKAPPFDMNHPLFKNQLSMGLAVNIFKEGRWGSLRRLELVQHSETRKRQDHSYVTADLLGDMSSLTWSMGPFNFGRPKGELVRVQFVGLNLRDVLIGSGKLTPNVFGLSRLDKDYAIGSEFSGVSERSRRVMGMVVGGAAATYVEADNILTWECPDKWTLQQAATVPVVYGVVYAAFFMVGQISSGKSVLIHAGCSDVGLAALRVATSYGLTVYTTVASAQEREFLLKTFAALTPENVGSYQDTSFEDLVKLRTHGKGVDFVLNSLEADKLQASLRCVAKGGKFLEIGQSDMARNQSMGLGQFLKAISFHAIIIDTLLRASTAEKQALRVIIDRDLKSGIILPLKTTVFPAKQVEKALRLLTTGKSTGKILLQIRERETDEPSLPVTVRPRVHCNPQFAYMVCGDLTSLGLEFLDWLVVRNCRKLCVNTKTTTSIDSLNYRLRIWRSYGVEIVTSTANVATKLGCKAMLAEAAKLGPIGGIFNLPTSHSDAEFEQLDHQVLDESVARKVTTTKLLDEISRKLCPQLQYFVAFTEPDMAGKSSDGLTNSIVEYIIERRHSQGLPAKVLQWSEKVEHKVSSCLKALDALLTNDSPIVCSSVTDNWAEGAEKSVIEAVMDVMSLKTVDLNKPLPELGMNPIMAAEIKQLLERELELFFAENEIEKLTLGKIQKLTEDPEKLNRKMANREIPLSMAELLRNLTDRGINERTIVRLETENKSKRYSSSVLIVPGIEGVLTGVWDNLARSLTASVCVAQLKSAADEIALSEINTQTADVKLEVFRQTEFFYLIGYSFGAFATLELARKLEATGMTGHVLLIDGAPEFLKKTAIRLLGDDYMAESLQTTLFTEIARVIVPNAGAEAVKTILATPQWTDRVDRIVQLAREQKRFSETYIRRVIATIFNRIRIALNTNLASFAPIKSPITLVRPNLVSLVEIDEHYGLAQCTEGQVITRFIEGNHISMLENPELAQLINKFDPVSHSTMTFKRYIESS